MLIQLKLLQDAPLDDAVRHRLDVVGRNVEQVKRLTSDLSDVSKLQDGRLKLVRQPMDLAATVRDVAESFQPIAAQRGVRLACDADAPLPVDGDAIRLRQILANLVSNALKYTSSGGQVTLAGSIRDGRVTVDAVDTGRGLTQDEQQRLFQPFSQVHKPEEAAERGTGLGLFISRGLAEGHGGTLSLRSEGLGAGSTFTLDLPLALAPANGSGAPADAMP